MLVVDGLAGPKTNAAIEKYQRDHKLPTDGRIDPSGPTLKHLVNAHLAAMEAGVIRPPCLGVRPSNAPPITQGQLVAVVRKYFDALRS